MPYWVYILANRKRGTLYIGVTSDLVRRIFQHRQRETGGFTTRYDLRLLVHFEQFEDPHSAIQREKNLKHWPRAWKLALIEECNPAWRDLYDDIVA